MTQHTSSTSDDIKSKAKAATEDLGNAARQTAGDAADAVREEATRHADSAKSGVADGVSDVASALRKAADEMRDGSPQERTFGQIANSLADVSDSIRGKDLGEMASEVSSFAKRNPMLFIGGIALAGFAVTRFATASGRRGDHPQTKINNPTSVGRSASANRPSSDNMTAKPNTAGGTS